MHNKKIAPLGNNAGFTLLEIIAVMVIMSILAVVAVPKYFDLQETAREKALETALAEAVSRVNSYFAKEVLDGTVPSDIVYSDDNLGTDMGDFTMAVYAPSGTVGDDFDPSVCTGTETTTIGCVQLTVTAKVDTAVGGSDSANLPSASKVIPRPGL